MLNIRELITDCLEESKVFHDYMIQLKIESKKQTPAVGYLPNERNSEKLARRHWDEGSTRNALVKGEGVVWLYYPLPLEDKEDTKARRREFCILFEPRTSTFSQLVHACSARASGFTRIICCRRVQMYTDKGIFGILSNTLRQLLPVGC